MAQTFIFKGEKPARLNLKELTTSVQAVEPEVVITFHEGNNWSSFPYNELPLPEYFDESDIPEDRDQPWQEPDVLIFENVPDQYTKAQVRNFILNHSPTKTDSEKRVESAGNKAIEILLGASAEKLQELRDALSDL